MALICKTIKSSNRLQRLGFVHCINPNIPISQTLRQSEYVEEIVKAALAKYDADKTGLFDFALESAGGSILSTRRACVLLLVDKF